jgi:hypothetical protein
MPRNGLAKGIAISEGQTSVAVADVFVGTEPTLEDCARIFLSTGLELSRLARALVGTGLTVPANA